MGAEASEAGDVISGGKANAFQLLRCQGLAIDIGHGVGYEREREREKDLQIDHTTRQGKESTRTGSLLFSAIALSSLFLISLLK